MTVSPPTRETVARYPGTLQGVRGVHDVYYFGLSLNTMLPGFISDVPELPGILHQKSGSCWAKWRSWFASNVITSCVVMVQSQLEVCNLSPPQTPNKGPLACGRQVQQDVSSTVVAEDLNGFNV